MLGVLDVILSICFVVCLSSILKTYSDISGTVSKNEAEILYSVSLIAVEFISATGTSDCSTLTGNVYRYSLSHGNLIFTLNNFAHVYK